MVVEVFVALDEGKNTLADLAVAGVGNKLRITGIGKNFRGTFEKIEPFFDLTNQEEASVGTHLAAMEIRLNFEVLTACEFELFCFTLCHRVVVSFL